MRKSLSSMARGSGVGKRVLPARTMWLHRRSVTISRNGGRSSALWELPRMHHIFLQIMALSAAGSVVVLPQTSIAQSMTPQQIKEFSLVDVPLAVDSVDTEAHADQIWASGERPANQLLGRIVLKPLEVATPFVPGEAHGQSILFRAFPGCGITRLPAGSACAQGARCSASPSSRSARGSSKRR